MIKQILIIAKFEFFRSVRKPAFWLTTIFMPLFIGGISFISGYSSSKTEETLQNLDENIKEIHILDNTGLINENLLISPFVKSTNEEKSKEKVKNQQIDALVVLPEDLLQVKKYNVYVFDTGNVFEQERIGGSVSNLLKASGLIQITDEDTLQLITQNFSPNLILFDKEGVQKSFGLEKFVIPVASMILFFLAVFISASFLLQSVSAEKENRMIETILSMTRSENLIYGKIFGLSAVVLAQLLVWISMSLSILYLSMEKFNFNISIDISSISWELVPINIYFILMAFFFYAAIMVGVGAVGTSYRESSGLSSIFIITAILPMYVIMPLISDPNGPLAVFFSYFPFTSSMILVLRNSFEVLSSFELILGMILNFVYTSAAFFLATKMFKIGSLMYTSKPSLKMILSIFRIR